MASDAARRMTAEERARAEDVAKRLEERKLTHHLETAAARFHAKPIEVCGPSKTKSNVAARHATWRALHELGLSWTEIAALWGTKHCNIILPDGRGRVPRAKQIEQATRRDVERRIVAYVRAQGHKALADEIEAGSWTVHT